MVEQEGERGRMKISTRLISNANILWLMQMESDLLANAEQLRTLSRLEACIDHRGVISLLITN